MALHPSSHRGKRKPKRSASAGRKGTKVRPPRSVKQRRR